VNKQTKTKDCLTSCQDDGVWTVNWCYFSGKNLLLKLELLFSDMDILSHS
jgi:hypothetical protein